MQIPDYQSIMQPLMHLAKDNVERSLHEAIKILAEEYGLTEEDLAERLPSGQQTIFHNRVGWARTYLSKAGLLETPRRGYFKITKRGQEVLARNLNRIDNETLKQFPEFVAFQNRKNEPENDSPRKNNSVSTPEESLYEAYQTLRDSLGTEILEKIKTCSPAFFERLAVELLVKMGYGGTFDEAWQAVGKSGDGGIDGIINEDRLGLDVIYIQAKRWEGGVGRPEIQKFAGALQGKRAKKGVFITTSNFTKEAREYVSFIDSKIILISGEELAELMIDYNVGVSRAGNYELKKIDSDYFIEE